MNSGIDVIAINPVSSIADVSACFANDGLVLADLSGWLVANAAEVALLRGLKLANAPVQSAP